jgi:hypothetical protein
MTNLFGKEVTLTRVRLCVHARGIPGCSKQKMVMGGQIAGCAVDDNMLKRVPMIIPNRPLMTFKEMADGLNEGGRLVREFFQKSKFFNPDGKGLKPESGCGISLQAPGNQ